MRHPSSFNFAGSRLERHISCRLPAPLSCAISRKPLVFRQLLLDIHTTYNSLIPTSTRVYYIPQLRGSILVVAPLFFDLLLVASNKVLRTFVYAPSRYMPGSKDDTSAVSSSLRLERYSCKKVDTSEAAALSRYSKRRKLR